eukprot:2610351-Rhodomonas_salina.1
MRLPGQRANRYLAPAVFTSIVRAGNELGRSTVLSYIKELEFEKGRSTWEREIEWTIEELNDMLDVADSSNAWIYRGPPTERGMNQLTNLLQTYNSERSHID